MTTFGDRGCKPPETPDPKIRYATVPDFPDYRVGEDGSVFKVVDGSWYRLSQVPICKVGYMSVAFFNKRKRVTRLVHRLVLGLFTEMRPRPWHTRHLDGNHLNNHISNLCWGTAKENCADRKRHGRDPKMIGEKNPAARFTEEQVIEMRRRRLAGQTLQKIADAFDADFRVIHQIVRGMTWKHLLGRELRSEIIPHDDAPKDAPKKET